ncbi:MAG: hypothetical protein WAN12_01535 [Candidatus Acidiferrum sp.]
MLLAAIVLPVPLTATTVVVFIANNGIVVSSDSKTVSRSADFSAVGEVDQPKFVVLQNRIVVAAIGVSDARDAVRHYNFLTWMKSLQQSLPVDVSVDEVTNLIERESAATFLSFDFNASLKSGAMKRKTPAEPCEVFAQFVIVGYQDRAPRVNKVQFDIDWNNQSLVGPIQTSIYPDPSETSNYRVIRFGTQQAITDVFNRKSYAYHEAMTLCPKAMTDVINRKYPSLDETVALSRVLVQVEENTNPDDVGGDIRSVKIPPTGRAEEVATRLTVAKTKATKQ